MKNKCHRLLLKFGDGIYQGNINYSGFKKLLVMEKITVAPGNLQKRNILIKTTSLLQKLGYRLSRRQTAIEIICSLFIILFIYTGLNKAMDYSNTKLQMQQSPFINNMAGFITATLPIGEIILAFLLILRKTRLLGLYICLFLMALFSGYIWTMLNYSYDLPCSCGGIISKMSWHDHLIFNIGFTILSIICIVLQSLNGSK